ncbi:MAG: ABC transporter permease [Spirochaetaceae bacterium]|jgi:putative ABC transport system permease protein|nr:ABC transporter permease [Spirochaetaceae bacterium]
MIEAIFIEGLTYSLMVLGVFITFRILDFADLTVDGTFPLGGAVTAFCLLNGLNPVLAFLLAFLAGCLGGLITALIHTTLKVPGLLAGILTMTMLYSLNIRVMDGKSYFSFLKIDTLFASLRQNGLFGFIPGELAVLVFLLIVVLCIKVLCDLFFRTNFGLTMGALGGNSQMIISQGMNPSVIKAVGIALSNGLVALSGSFASLYNGFSDVGSGNGIVVSGLASVMLGEFLLRSNKIMLLTFRVILGSILYRALMFFARVHGHQIGMGPNDFKLLTGLLIVVCLIVSKYRGSFFSDMIKSKNIGRSIITKKKDTNARP